MDPIVIAALIGAAAYLTPHIIVSYLQARAVGNALKDMATKDPGPASGGDYL